MPNQYIRDMDIRQEKEREQARERQKKEYEQWKADLQEFEKNFFGESYEYSKKDDQFLHAHMKEAFKNIIEKPTQKSDYIKIIDRIIAYAPKFIKSIPSIYLHDAINNELPYKTIKGLINDDNIFYQYASNVPAELAEKKYKFYNSLQDRNEEQEQKKDDFFKLWNEIEKIVKDIKFNTRIQEIYDADYNNDRLKTPGSMFHNYS